MNGVKTYPGRVYLETASTNSSALADLTPTAADPDYQIRLPGHTHTGLTPRGLRVIPIGTDENNETFSFQITGWTEVQSSDGRRVEYFPIMVWKGAVTLGAETGSGGSVATTYFVADTLTETTGVPTALGGLSGFSSNVHSPGSDGVAWVAIADMSHVFNFFTIEFSNNGKTAASMNAIIQEIF